MPKGYIYTSGYNFPLPDWLTKEELHLRGCTDYVLSLGTGFSGLDAALGNIAECIGPNPELLGFGCRYKYSHALTNEADTLVKEQRLICSVQLEVSVIIHNEALRVHFRPLEREIRMGNLPDNLFPEISDWLNEHYTPYQSLIEHTGLVNKSCDRLFSEIKQGKVAPMVRTNMGLLNDDLKLVKNLVSSQLRYMVCLLGEPIKESVVAATAQ